MDLNDIRKKIDTIDFEILKLLNSRMEYAIRTRKFKRGITDSKRESEVIEYIRKHAQGLIEPEFCKGLFSQIILESKRLQGGHLKLIGFRGEHGSFSEVAARQFDPSLMFISCDEFREIFEAVDTGLLHYGVVSVETTAGGTVADVSHLLLDTQLHIVGEVKTPTHYCLLALPDTDPKEIRAAYSDPAALSQCQDFLTRRDLEGRPYYDSAGAAKMLLRARPKGCGAIASSFAAEFYNLDVVEADIEDYNNYTRFLVLSKDPADRQGNKCSIVFATEHRAGALFRVLKAFADEGINLTRIESMPNRKDPQNYLFFVDFHGSSADPVVRRTLGRVEGMSTLYRFLGCYQEGSNVTPSAAEPANT
jgi:prephenate dehydratase/chorismate mutase